MRDMTDFIQRQIAQLRRGGGAVMTRKLRSAAKIFARLAALVLAAPAAVVLWLVRPWFLVRLGSLPSARIGHFAGNTELYLCERDAGINVPRRLHVDIFFLEDRPCN